MAQAVAAYVKADVVPEATRLMVANGYLRRYLGEAEVQNYVTGLTKLGAALQILPQDFNMSQITGREGDLQVALRDAVDTLRPVYRKLPDSKSYLDQLERLLQLTTVERIGQEVEQQHKRQESQH